MTRITLALLLLLCIYYVNDPIPFGLENYDGFELVTAMVTGGIAHPPGYGFYLELNRWFHELLNIWGISPELSMTYFQCLCCFTALVIFLKMIEIWKGSGLLFLFLMMSCASFTQNLYSVEVYGLLLLLLSISLKLYFFRLSVIPHWLQNFLLGAVISLMVAHHLSLAPLAILMVYRRYKEYKFSVGLNLGLMLGGLLSLVLCFRSSQTTMNPWFDGSDSIAFWQHITAKVYQAAFLDLGIHIDAGRNFLSVWPLEIWIIMILILFLHARGVRFQLHLAILSLLVWPLFVYNIPDISKPLITFYILIAVYVSCAKIQTWFYLILLVLSVTYSLKEAQKFKFLALSYEKRSMDQSIKDAHVAVSKRPDSMHTFIGYDSTFGIAYARHVLRSKESTRMSIFPMWWLSFHDNLGSIKNYKFSSDSNRSDIVHWSGLNEFKLKQLYSSSNHFMQGFGLNGIYPRVAQFEQLKLSLDLLNDKGTIFYVPSGKPDLMKYLSQLGYGFVNRGFWNQLKLEVRNKPLSRAIVQKVYLQKRNFKDYRVHIIFLDSIEQELEFKLSKSKEWIPWKITVSNQEWVVFRLPLEKIDGRNTTLQILGEGKLLSEVTLVID